MVNRKRFVAKSAIMIALLSSTVLFSATNVMAEGSVTPQTGDLTAGCRVDNGISYIGGACAFQGYVFAKMKYVSGSGYTGSTPLLMGQNTTNPESLTLPDCSTSGSDGFFVFGSLKYATGDKYYNASGIETTGSYEYHAHYDGVFVGGLNDPYADEWVAGLHYGNKIALYILGEPINGNETISGYSISTYNYDARDWLSKRSHHFDFSNSPLKIFAMVNGTETPIAYMSDILTPSGNGTGNNSLMNDLGLAYGNNRSVYCGGGDFGINWTWSGGICSFPNIKNLPDIARTPNYDMTVSAPESGSRSNPYHFSSSSSNGKSGLYKELIDSYNSVYDSMGASDKERTPRVGVCSWSTAHPSEPKVDFTYNGTTTHNENNGARKNVYIELGVNDAPLTIKFKHTLARADGKDNQITISGSAHLDSTTKSFSGQVSGATTSVIASGTDVPSVVANPASGSEKTYCGWTKNNAGKSSGEICVTVKRKKATVSELVPTSTIRKSDGSKLDGCPSYAQDFGVGVLSGSMYCPLILPADGKVVLTTKYSVAKPNPYDQTNEKYNASDLALGADTSIKFKVKHGFQTFVSDDSSRYDTYGNLYGNYGGNLRIRNLNWGYAKPGSTYSQYTIGSIGLNVEWTNQSVTTNKITETLVTKDIKYGDLIRVKHNPSTAKYVFSLGSNKYEDGVKTTESGFDVYLYKQQANCNWYNYYITDPSTVVGYGIDSAHNYGGIRYKNYTTNRVAIADGNGVSQQTAWARPMDSINFGNYVCSGSNYAVENSAKLSSYTNKKANYKLTTTTRNGGSSRVWTRKITAKNPASSGTDPSSILNEDGVYDTSVTTPKITSGSSLTCYGNGSNSTYVITSGYANTSNRCNSISNMDLGGSFTETMTWKDYPIENYALTNTNGIDKSASVEVKVPYNYYIEPTVESSGTDDMIYPDGSAKKYKISVNVKARKNEVVDNDEYATTTKHTKIQVITYKLDSSVANYTIDNKYSSLPSTTYVRSGNILNTIRDSYNVNNNYTFVSQYELKGENSGESSRVFNKPSSSSTSTPAPDTVPNYSFSIVRNDGTGTSQNNSGYNNIAYDEGVEFNIGDKICVVVAAYPADSHNSIGSDVNDPDRFTLSGDYYQDAALNGDDGESVQNGYWAISKPSCGSTGKRPNMSVESSWLYTTQSVKGIMTRRSAASRYYGSWAEYGILSTGNSKVSMFASSASIAYQPGAYPSNPNDKITSADGGGTESSTSIGTSMCSNTELLTISSDCNPDLYTNATNLKAKLESKINRSSTSLTSYLNSRFELGTISGLSGNYTYTGGDLGLAISNASSNVTYNAEANSAVLKSATGTITLDAGSGSDLNFNTGDVKTSIVYAKNVVINSNIIVSNNPMSSAGQAKAVIIVATGDIKIASNVTRIDAWLVSGGEINTCYKDNGRTITNVKDLALDVCNQTLVIDAPVYAKNIKLFRTAGGSGAVSGSGGMSSDEQMKRAEVFNFNTVNYFWAQTEIQSTETITTTDIKELPVRY